MFTTFFYRRIRHIVFKWPYICGIAIGITGLSQRQTACAEIKEYMDFKNAAAKSEALRYAGEAIVRVDESFLPTNIAELLKGNIRFELYPDGQLKNYGYYSNSKPAEILQLEYQKMSGTSGNKEQYDRYFEGAHEHIRPWSDNSYGTPTAWSSWVKNEIIKITKYAE
jgi:hypothetical protein